MENFCKCGNIVLKKIGRKNKISEESKIKLKDGTVIKIKGGEEKKNASISIYEGDYKNKDDHSAIHININTETGKGYIVEHGPNHTNKEKTDIECYLTTACMKSLESQFDDDCYELRVLRWFRDQLVMENDIKYYDQVAPIIVEAINQLEPNKIIYNQIYNNIVKYCVNKIESEKYEEAYNRYKNSILYFEEQFARPFLTKKLVKTLKKIK